MKRPAACDGFRPERDSVAVGLHVGGSLLTRDPTMRHARSTGAGRVRRLVRAHRARTPWASDDAVVDPAWRLLGDAGPHCRYALPVAAAQQQGCKRLRTEDPQPDQRIDSLRIVSPFGVRPFSVRPFSVGPEILDTSE